jgi:hypothetical protein
MKYLKKYQKFFEDGEGGTAYANASISGMGPVVAPQPGVIPGTTGTEGSDRTFTFGPEVKSKSSKRGKRGKKGKPSEVSDLRDLGNSYTVNLKE